jgi:glycosidase
MKDQLPWWQEGVIYQIYPRSFQDSNGDGIGDLRGMTERLDYLAWLGVDAVWISPIYRSPMADFGYDIADHTDIDPMFGDLAAFDQLVAAARARGLHVLLDYVPNHTSDRHPWFVESRRSRTDPRRDWYVWRDQPNNWLSVFGGGAWQWDETTRQYYLHSFLREQPDLNWRNPEVRAAMNDVLRFWLDRGVDGFRIDVAFYVMKDPEFRDNPANLGPIPFHRSLGAYDSQIHKYDKGHPDVHDVFREWRQLLDRYGAMCIAEIHEFDWSVWATYYGANLDELHMPFNFGLLATPWAGRAVRTHVEAIERAVPAGAWPNYVLGNHDEPRLASRIGSAAARAAAMLLLTLRGTPTLYYGDELGMSDVAIPPDREQDPWGKLTPGLGRDPCRTPMPWTPATNAGFCPSGTTPWLPLGPDAATRNVELQREDPRSHVQLVRALLALRRTEPELRRAPFAAIASPDDTFVFTRGSLAIAINFADAERTIALPADNSELVLSTELDRRGRTGPALALRAHEGCVVRLV